MASTYGKMPTDDSVKQIVMELKYWLILLTDMLPPEIEHMTDGVP